MLKVNNCPACGGTNAFIVAQLDGDTRQRFVDFDRIKYGGLLASWIEMMPVKVLACNVCEHAWYLHQPEPEQLALMYASGRPLNAKSVLSNAPSGDMQKEMSRLRRLVKVNKDSPLLLDYGSGRGRWARAALQVGFRVVAFEPCVERGGEDSPPFRLVHLESDLANMCFDVINLEQVLEHVSNPLMTLAKIKRCCHAQTIVRITVPNVKRDPDAPHVWNSWPWDGKAPHVLAPFEHLHGFTPASLARLCTRAGYRPISPSRIVRTHPINLFRRLLGILCPGIGTTAQYLVPQSSQT